jgi:group II intron reverse transcriptase/maturase
LENATCHDSGVSIVVRDRESRLHGEGGQVISLLKLKEVCEMQKANLILTKLYQKSKEDHDFKFRRLYRNLFNNDFYLTAYAKIYATEGNMTKGIDGKTIDGFSMIKIQSIISKMKCERYKPKAVRRTYIPKKNGKMRPLGIPTFDDKLVQEVLRQILQAIYEPIFKDNSHGFRPYRNCHTALFQIKTVGTGAAWAIEGDISKFFDSIDHEILIGILRRKIKDGRILELIRRFLKAGYMEQKMIKYSPGGTPQGGNISPILANIYLHEMDEYILGLKNKFDKGKKRKNSALYSRTRKRMTTMFKKGDIKKALEVKKSLFKIPYGEVIDSEYRRMQYIRYADDFIILIIGSKNMAKELRENIKLFLKSELKIELNEEKTLITNMLKGKAHFLSYDICKSKDNTRIKVNVKGIRQRSINGNIQLYVPHKEIQKKIAPFRKKNKPIHRAERAYLPLFEMISLYNSEIRGLYNYYSMANNVAEKMQTFKHYHYTSLLRTIANKEKSTVYKVIKKYGIPVKRRDKSGTRNLVAVKYKTANGEEKILSYFNDSLVKQNRPINYFASFPTDIHTQYETSELIRRIYTNKCELCHENVDINEVEVHHIRKLKDLRKKWEHNKNAPDHVRLMIKMKRKTLILCKDCHKMIHHKNT